MQAFFIFKGYVTCCAIWYHLYNLKNVKNSHGGVLVLLKLKASACNFTKINASPWVFSRFLNCTNATKSRNAPHIVYQVFQFFLNSLHCHWCLFLSPETKIMTSDMKWLNIFMLHLCPYVIWKKNGLTVWLSYYSEMF